MTVPLVVTRARARAFDRYTDRFQIIAGSVDATTTSQALVSVAATASATITASQGGTVTLLTNNCEAGVTTGTAVTTVNSENGAGNSAFTAVSAVTAGAITYSAANPYKGALAIATVQANSANACTFEWADPTPASALAVRCYLLLNSYPSATCQGPINIRSAASAALGRLNMTATGQLSMTLGTNNVVSATSTATLDLATWYRIEVTGGNFGASNTTLHTDVFVGDATSAYFSLDIPVGSAAVTPAAAAIVRFGRNNAVGTNDWLFDDVALNVGSATLIGPSASGDAGDSQTVQPGEPVSLVGTGTGTWTQSSGPAVTLSGSGSTRSFSAPAVLTDTDLVFLFGGASTTVTVLAATESVNRGGTRVPAVINVAS